MRRDSWKSILLRLLAELVIYGLLLVAYFLLIIRLLRAPLTGMFQVNLPLYAGVGLGLLIVQAVVLDVVTSFLVEHLRLERLD